jgi:CBS domain containing-hemolysin-like protein
MGEIGIVTLVILLLVLLNGVFVAAEFAIIATSRAGMATRAEAGDRNAANVARIMNDPVLLDRYVATAQLGITFASLGLGMYGEHKLATYLEGWLQQAGFSGAGTWITAHGIAVVVAIGLLTYLHIVLGEMIPKSLAINQSIRTALWVAGPMMAAGIVFAPLVRTLNWIGNQLLQLVGFRRARAAGHSPEELESIARESRAGGLLGPESARVFQELVDARVIGHQPHTRYPVYEQSLDRILGTVHIRDLLGLLAERRSLSAREVRETAYLPETAMLDDVIVAMRRVRNQMVVVMDEHGGTAGTLTMEDLYVEAVGDVEEGAEDVPDIIPLGGERYRVQGILRLDTFGDALGLELDHPDVDTVSGLVLDQLGRPPRLGDSVLWKGIRFDVSRLHGRGVAEVIAWRMPAPFEEDAEPQEE